MPYNIDTLKRLVNKISNMRVRNTKTLRRLGIGTLYDEQQFCYDRGFKDGVKEYRKMIKDEMHQTDISFYEVE